MMNDQKRKKETIEGNQGKPAKDPLIVKSIFSLGLKFSKWMNSRMYFGLVGLGPFYREFGVSLLVRCR